MTVGPRPPGRCQRPGCAGRLIGGACDTCGQPAPSQQQPPQQQPAQQQPPQQQPAQQQPPQQQQWSPQQPQFPSTGSPAAGQYAASQSQQQFPQTGPQAAQPAGQQFPLAGPRPAQPTGQRAPRFPQQPPQQQPPPRQQPPPSSQPFPVVSPYAGAQTNSSSQQQSGPARSGPGGYRQGPPSQPFPAQQAVFGQGPPALAAPAPTMIVVPPHHVGGQHAAAAARTPNPHPQPVQHKPEQPDASPNNPLSERLSGREHRKNPGPDTAMTQLALGESTRLAKPTGASGPPSVGSLTGRGNRSSRVRTRGTASRRIGGGLVEVPRVPYRDPASAIMPNPEVPENKRFCGNCVQPVGRGVNGEPGSPDGRCAGCGTAFSFRAKLHAGDLVGGQYEVLGALAHGGLGWIYLARDHNVNDRWVVLKGLIDTGDTSAMAAAVAEKQFLSQVEHANIVKIYNFVEHTDPTTGNQVGYIVMEYIGGESLRQIALAHQDTDGRVTPLPLARVLAYGLEVLPAMAYLHSVGLIYSDLKPDNVIQTDAQVKLIDLGAVRHVDDMVSPIFFTSGYSAPEIATDGPSIASDIYTVGRMLAVLSFDFVGYTTDFRYQLPTPNQVPLFSLFGSYHRLLKRATHPDPDRRFTSADDMADQLTGVLREVLALGTREPRPGRSTVFGPEVRTFGAELVRPTAGNPAAPAPPSWADVVSGLPIPLVDADDPAAGLVGGLASTAGAAPAQQLEALRAAPPASMEAKLWRAKALLDLGELNQAGRELADAAALDAQGQPMPELPYDWRISWSRGLLALAARRPRDARAAFEHVYDVVPGELAPKLALAVSAECCGDHFAAARLYELVWRTDRAFVTAAFGLARTYLALGDRAGALEVLESVPDRSSHYIAAQMAVVAARTSWTPPERLSERDLLDAGVRVERLNLDAERRAKLAADVLTTAVDWVRAGRPNASGATGGRVLGCELDERGLRFGLEGCYRLLARLAGTLAERVELVDRANQIRPRTLT